MKIAVTGGIGCGKSYVCDILRKRGFDIYDCDAAAKRLMLTSDDIRVALKELIGDDVYSDGVLNKRNVSDFLLKSDENKLRVNNIVHPVVADDFIESGLEWMECAILFSSGFDKLVDKVICVTAPLEVRIDRIMKRDGLTREKALEWIDAQMEQKEIERRSDFVIVNDGVSDLEEQIDIMFK